METNLFHCLHCGCCDCGHCDYLCRGGDFQEKGGKINDLKNGKASYAVMKGKPISIHPDTKADLSKLIIPNWEEHLAIAYKACEITNLNYVGVDIVLDKTRGALLLEINARPGLAIQIANRIGLKHRLDIVDNNIKLMSKMSNEEKFNFICEHF